MDFPLSETILERIASGEQAAVSECLARHGGLVWSMAQRFARRREDAEDAVQEIFLEVWKTAERYDPTLGSETVFISTIARRRLIDRLRRAARSGDTLPLEPEQAPVGDQPSDSVETCEEAAIARQELGKLPDDQRRAIELAVCQGLTHAEVAQTTGLPLGTVKTYIRRGLQKVQKSLAARSATLARGGGV